MVGVMVINTLAMMFIVLIIGFKGLILLSIRYTRFGILYSKISANWCAEKAIRF